MLRRSGLWVAFGVLVMGAACVGDPPASGPSDTGADAGMTSSSSGSADSAPGQTWSVAVASPVSVVRGKSVKLELAVTGTVSSPLLVQVQNAAGFSGSTTLSTSATSGTLDLQVEATRPFGTATVPLSVSDGVYTETLEAVVQVRGVPGTLDETFGQGGSVLAPRPRGHWFFTTGAAPALHWLGEVAGAADVTTALRRYLEDGSLDPSYGGAGATTWTWTGDRSQDVRELFGAPLVRSTESGIELLGGYSGDNEFFVHVRAVPADGRGEARLLPGTDVYLDNLLSRYYRADHEPDAITRLPDGRIVTVGLGRTPARLIASVWNNGVLDPSWPESGAQSIALGSVPESTLQSILITATHIYVGGHADATGSAVFAFALSGAGWRLSEQITGAPDGLSNFTETSDGKVHALVGQGRPGDAVNLYLATLKTETIGAGNETLSDRGALNYRIVDRGVLTAGLSGSTIWCRRDPDAPQAILVLAANALNQPLDSFGTGGELKLQMDGLTPALPLSATTESVRQAFTGPDQRLYMVISGEDATRVYRIWL